VIEAIISISLFTYAFTYMLKYTDGPFDVFWRIRKSFGTEKLEEYDPVTDEYYFISEEFPDNFFGRLFNCWWCLSTWVSIFGVILYVAGLYPILYWLSAVAISYIAHKYFTEEVVV